MRKKIITLFKLLNFFISINLYDTAIDWIIWATVIIKSYTLKIRKQAIIFSKICKKIYAEIRHSLQNTVSLLTINTKCYSFARRKLQLCRCLGFEGHFSPASSQFWLSCGVCSQWPQASGRQPAPCTAEPSPLQAHRLHPWKHAPSHLPQIIFSPMIIRGFLFSVLLLGFIPMLLYASSHTVFSTSEVLCTSWRWIIPEVPNWNSGQVSKFRTYWLGSVVLQAQKTYPAISSLLTMCSTGKECVSESNTLLIQSYRLKQDCLFTACLYCLARVWQWASHTPEWDMPEPIWAGAYWICLAWTGVIFPLNWSY